MRQQLHRQEDVAKDWVMLLQHLIYKAWRCVMPVLRVMRSAGATVQGTGLLEDTHEGG